MNGTATQYRYHGSVLISQVTGSNKLLFSYDANGNAVAVNYNGTYYYYVRNGQNDVIRLIDGSNNTVVEYSYDSWGRLLSCTGSLASTLGTQNPFRYRGYVYDTETGLYYLQTRYYDPEVGRFINADAYVSTGQGVLGNNMYLYCGNNPVNVFDPTGQFGWFSLAAAVLGAVVGAATQIATNVLTGNNNVLEGVIGAALGGAVYNVVALSGNIVAASAAGSATEAFVNEVGSYIFGGKKLSKENVLNSLSNVARDTVEGTITASITGKASSKIVKINSGWFKPKKFVSSFTGKYARKLASQTAVQGLLTVGYNSMN